MSVSVGLGPLKDLHLVGPGPLKEQVHAVRQQVVAVG
jgi:hypothetical protein